MNQDLVNAFIAPAKKIWEMEFGLSLDLKRAESVSNQITTEDISAYINVTGDSPGTVMYGFNLGTAKKVVGQMMGQEVNTLDDVAASALVELANMISVHASAELSNAGFNCKFDQPVLISPAGSWLAYMTNPHIKAMFASDLGNLVIHIGLHSDSSDDSTDWLWQRWK